MEYRAIVITGIADADEAQVCKSLCDSCPQFYAAVLTTTRPKDVNKIEGQYEYLTREEFEELVNDDQITVKTEHNGNWYGIRKSSPKTTKGKEKIPVVLLQTSALSQELEQSTNLFSIFLDKPDDLLDVSHVRAGGEVDKGILEQRKKDRKVAPFCTYSIVNLDTSRTVELILTLWEHRNNGGVIPRRLIDLAIDCGVLLDDVDDKKKIQGASYDLSLGDEYYYGGQIKTLTDKDPFICIEPYDYAIVTSKENANFPRDIAARFGLAVSLFCQGVILSNGPQVDPGFKGKLFCLLFNTSNAPVFLKRGQHYATLEFHKLIEPTDPYKGRYQDKVGIVDYLPSNTLKGGVNELKKELEQVKSQGQGLQTTILGMLSVLLAIIALLLALR